MARVRPIENRILAAVTDNCTLIVVIGQGNYRLAQSFKQASQAARLAGSHFIVVDMARCVSMDSTFMGALANLGLAVKKSEDTQLALINVSTNAYALLKGLGLNRLLKTYTVSELPEGLGNMNALVDNLRPVEADPLSAREMAVFMYDAHETLTKVDPANLQQFKNVLAFLKEDIQQAPPEPPSPASKTADGV